MMSTSCKIMIRNADWIKREIVLSQPTEGHPNNMILSLIEELSEIHEEFKENGDVDWFMDPSKVAGSLVMRSAPVMTEDIRKLIKSLPNSSRSRLESSMMTGMPTIFPDHYRVKSIYDYVITLRESLDEYDNPDFFGYTIEVYKLLNGRRISTILQEDRNLLRKVSFTSDNM